MASVLDNLPKQLQSLQLLIDQFRDAEDWDERDEVLNDIIAHDTPEATVFLRRIADNAAEDVYTRCDAICGLVRRTQGRERVEDMLPYLQDLESTYEYCRAADTAGDVGVQAAVPLLWAAWGQSLNDDALHSTVLALEQLVPQDAAERFVSALEAQKSLETLDFVRADLMLKSLAQIKPHAHKPRLLAWEAALRELAKAHPDDEAEFQDIADLAREAMVRFDEASDVASDSDE